jgi:serine phosphatase RsbU (regulator of sigma subunit)
VEIQVGAAKASKYASQESGDTLEVIERPHGGLSAVLVDGQRSGRAAKIISNIVARKTISLLGEGIRDGAVARAAHDYLRTHRLGRVSAELQVISVDLDSFTLVISRNSQCPVLVSTGGQLQPLDTPSQPIGIHVHTKPVITELPLVPDTYVVAFTDGLRSAGERSGMALDVGHLVQQGAQERITAQQLSEVILERALEADDHRPADDISILVVAVLPDEVPDGVRRFSMHLLVPASQVRTLPESA